jgi:hypothetical protein
VGLSPRSSCRSPSSWSALAVHLPALYAKEGAGPCPSFLPVLLFYAGAWFVGGSVPPHRLHRLGADSRIHRQEYLSLVMKLLLGMGSRSKPPPSCSSSP